MSRYDIEKFDPPPDPDLVCCICQCVLDHAVECPCRHVFCQACIERWLTNRHTCPTCRTRTKKQDLKPVLPLVQNMLNRMLMICDFRDNGCLEKIMLEHFDRHVKGCGYEMKTCRFSKCRAQILKMNLEDHETNVCDHRESMCQGECGLMIPLSDRPMHNCVAALKENIDEKNIMIEILKAKLQELNNLSQSLNDQLEQLRQQLNDRPPRFLDPLSDTSSDDDDDIVDDIFSDDNISVDSFPDTLSNHSDANQDTTDGGNVLFFGDNQGGAAAAAHGGGGAGNPGGNDDGADVVEQVERTVVNSLFELSSRLERVRNQMRAVLNSGLVQEQNNLNDEVRIPSIALDAIVNNSTNNTNVNEQPSGNDGRNSDIENNNNATGNNSDDGHHSSPNASPASDSDTQSIVRSIFTSSDDDSTPVNRSPAFYTDTITTSLSSRQSEVEGAEDSDNRHVILTQPPDSPSASSDCTDMSSTDVESINQSSSIPTITSPVSSPAEIPCTSVSPHTEASSCHSWRSDSVLSTASEDRNNTSAILISSWSSSSHHSGGYNSANENSNKEFSDMGNSDSSSQHSFNHLSTSTPARDNVENNLLSTDSHQAANDTDDSIAAFGDHDHDDSWSDSGSIVHHLSRAGSSLDGLSVNLHSSDSTNTSPTASPQATAHSDYDYSFSNQEQPSSPVYNEATSPEVEGHSYHCHNSGVLRYSFEPSYDEHEKCNYDDKKASGHENTSKYEKSSSFYHRQDPIGTSMAETGPKNKKREAASDNVKSNSEASQCLGTICHDGVRTESLVYQCEPDSTQGHVPVQTQTRLSVSGSNSSSPVNFPTLSDPSDTDGSDSMKYITKRLRRHSKKDRRRSSGNMVETATSQDGKNASCDSGLGAEANSQSTNDTESAQRRKYEFRKRQHDGDFNNSSETKKTKFDDKNQSLKSASNSQGDGTRLRSHRKDVPSLPKRSTRSSTSHKRSGAIQSENSTQDQNAQSLNVKIDLSLINYSGSLGADTASNAVPSATVVHGSANISPYHGSSKLHHRQTYRPNASNTSDTSHNTTSHKQHSKHSQKHTTSRYPKRTTSTCNDSNMEKSTTSIPAGYRDVTNVWLDEEEEGLSSDNTWEPGSEPDTDLTVTEGEDCETDSSYEVQVPKSAATLLEEYASDSSDQDWTLSMS